MPGLFQCEILTSTDNGLCHFIGFAHAASRKHAKQMFVNSISLSSERKRIQSWSNESGESKESKESNESGEFKEILDPNPYPAHIRYDTRGSDDFRFSKRNMVITNRSKAPVVVTVNMSDKDISLIQNCSTFTLAMRKRRDIQLLSKSDSLKLFVCPTFNLDREKGKPKVMTVLAKNAYDATRKIIDAHERLGIYFDDIEKKSIRRDIYHPGNVMSISFRFE
jgi:hypothetical protein